MARGKGRHGRPNSVDIPLTNQRLMTDCFMFCYVEVVSTACIGVSPDQAHFLIWLDPEKELPLRVDITVWSILGFREMLQSILLRREEAAYSGLRKVSRTEMTYVLESLLEPGGPDGNPFALREAVLADIAPLENELREALIEFAAKHNAERLMGP